MLLAQEQTLRGKRRLRGNYWETCRSQRPGILTGFTCSCSAPWLWPRHRLPPSSPQGLTQCHILNELYPLYPTKLYPAQAPSSRTPCHLSAHAACSDTHADCCLLLRCGSRGHRPQASLWAQNPLPTLLFRGSTWQKKAALGGGHSGGTGASRCVVITVAPALCVPFGKTDTACQLHGRPGDRGWAASTGPV